MATSSWFVVFVFSVSVYSISNHFVYAHGPMHVYDKIRNIAHRIHPNLGELFECMICFPTWVGMALSAMNYFFLNGVALTPFMILLNGIVDNNCSRWVLWVSCRMAYRHIPERCRSFKPSQWIVY